MQELLWKFSIVLSKDGKQKRKQKIKYNRLDLSPKEISARNRSYKLLPTFNLQKLC